MRAAIRPPRLEETRLQVGVGGCQPRRLAKGAHRPAEAPSGPNRAANLTRARAPKGEEEGGEEGRGGGGLRVGEGETGGEAVPAWAKLGGEG